MRTIDATTKTEKNASANKPIFLYTIYDYDGASNNLNYAEYDADVVYDGVTYTKFPITHEYVKESTQGDIDTVKIKVANISRVIQAYLELYDLRGKKIRIMLVWANQLEDTDANIKDYYYIDNYTADEMNVEFNLSSKWDVLDVTLPNRRYSRNYCAWKFKGTECGYSGAETTCNKTFQKCKALSNYQRFGGFPSIPSRNLVVG